jgi:hypothetical protein
LEHGRTSVHCLIYHHHHHHHHHAAAAAAAVVIVVVSCHRPFLPGTSLEPTVIPTTHASSSRL